MSEFLHEEHEQAGAAAWAFRAALMVLAALAVWFAATQLKAQNGLPPPAETHNVTLLDEPPPPLPDEPPEPEPEYDEAQEVIAENTEPESTPELTNQLGVIGDGIAGGDAFGLRSRQDGIDAFRAMSGGNGGSGNLAHRLWSDGVGATLRDDLQRYPELREVNYRVKLEMRFDDDGDVTRCQLIDSTGRTPLDELIEQRCSRLSVGAPPPDDLAQPLRLAVNVYGARR
jgi:protein TonB